ncbi:MAG: DUF177 domain-containing protein [Deltaproteobacteria bacterium]|nr:DUF177 domain-containing protein [Deltaproteobacteria bacterium]MBN2671311.1 DUF177 domain-containing protein [Deltaproteobacteria bacterium]
MSMVITNENRKALFKIDVLQLHRPQVFNWVLSQEWTNALLSQCEYPVEAVSGKCTLNAAPTDSGIQLTGAVRFQIKTDCNTCLNKLLLDLSAHIDTFMQPAEAADVLQEEWTPEDLDIEYYTGNTIVLDEFIGDSILLELPMIPRCSGTCRKIKGLMTADELEKQKSTVDPRLRALADIKLS